MARTCCGACARWMRGCTTCNRNACARPCNAPTAPRCACMRCGRRRACRCCGSASRRPCAACCWHGDDNWSVAMPGCATPMRCCARCNRGGGWPACMSGWPRSNRVHRPRWRDACNAMPCTCVAWCVRCMRSVRWRRSRAATQSCSTTMDASCAASVMQRPATRSTRVWSMGGCASGWNHPAIVRFPLRTARR
jgi:hypothetical protein